MAGSLELPPLNQLHVVGIGLEGPVGLSPTARQQVQTATLIAGSDRHLHWFSEHPAQKLVLGDDINVWIQRLQTALREQSVVVLASGDPLFFGIGRLLTEHFPSDVLVFYPHVSSVQLALSRLQLPWQSATVVSVHGRDPERLTQALRKGASPIAVLTDGTYTPGAIARLILDLGPPVAYKLWVCSELGSTQEQIKGLTLTEAVNQVFPVPNIVVLVKVESEPEQVPLLGIPDRAFHTFPDQPGLITKQEVRALTLSLLRLMPRITVWDIGAGTGSIAVEIARLVPDAQIFAVERSAAGVTLIQRNCERFGVDTVQIIAGTAPETLVNLPAPDRIVLGGGGAKIAAILDVCCQRLKPGGVLVGNFATLETCLTAQAILQMQAWLVHLLQVNLARSTTLQMPKSATRATRFLPLNPVILLQARKPGQEAVGD